MILGIDPGKQGAIACVSPDYSAAMFLPMLAGHDLDLDELMMWVRNIPCLAHIRMVILEKAQPMPKQGIVSAFHYGDHYGQLKCWLRVKGWPFLEVSPAKWKQAMGLNKKSKDECIRVASQLFPHVDLARKKDHNRAEALLLAEYGRRYCA